MLYPSHSQPERAQLAQDGRDLSHPIFLSIDFAPWLATAGVGVTGSRQNHVLHLIHHMLLFGINRDRG
jgi:hypothetical protein